MTTAVVTLAHGRHDHLAAQRRSLEAGTRIPDLYVVVAIDDPWIETWSPGGRVRPVVLTQPSDPRGLPLAAARNAGVRGAAALGADVVIGLDVDCLAARDLVAAYDEVVSDEPAVVWSGPVTYLSADASGRGYDLRRLDEWDDPHPARPSPVRGELERDCPPDLFWSLSFALHRDLWDRIGGFCEDYVGYGAEDTDFGQLVAAAEVEMAFSGSARAYHQHHGSETPPVRHLDDLLRNGELFAHRWGRWPMTGWFEVLERRGLVTRAGPGWVSVRQQH